VETGAIGSPTSATGADLVVAADQELHRVIESGATVPELDVDVARIPWVLAGAPGTPSPEIGALARSATRVRVLDGHVSREALRTLSLLGAAPGHAERFDGARGPVWPLCRRTDRPAEPPGPPVLQAVRAPITARALGVRASGRKDGALDSSVPRRQTGSAAFRACGREDVP
jgi:hypothetical protein